MLALISNLHQIKEAKALKGQLPRWETCGKLPKSYEIMKELAEKIIQHDRRALARAITLVESSRDDHRAQALELSGHLQKAGRQALRIGLSGTPGVGKSTFIESFGTFLTSQKLRVAVLAVDPSSIRSGGSILGDKTRMDRLSRDPLAFIRPSPSLSHLGGVTRRTREAVAVCEAAGFDVVLVETVGVGQSETIVSELSDVFVLLLSPTGGDELQGVKRGIMEMADLVLVNKADGDLKSVALRTRAEFSAALRLLRKRPQDPEGYPSVLTVSAIDEIGLDVAWEAVQSLVQWRRSEGYFDRQRALQARFWFNEDVKQGVLASLSQVNVMELMRRIGHEVENGDLLPEVGAAQVLRELKQLR